MFLESKIKLQTAQPHERMNEQTNVSINCYSVKEMSERSVTNDGLSMSSLSACTYES